MGVETADPSILKTALGKGEKMQELRNILERVCKVGEEPGKRKHSFHRHHFRSPRWCDYCKKFIYGLTYQVLFFILLFVLMIPFNSYFSL